MDIGPCPLVGTLFAGLKTGIYTSPDKGKTWQTAKSLAYLSRWYLLAMILPQNQVFGHCSRTNML